PRPRRAAFRRHPRARWRATQWSWQPPYRGADSRSSRYLHPVLSVLLPARNAAATLRSALEGLFAQRGAPPFEIVCVDDASSDDTPRILAAAREADSRLVVVQGE